MHEFGKKLSELIEKYNIKASYMCDKVGINKAYFSKMKSGTILPQKCEIVCEIADAIGVTKEEKLQLCKLYCISKLDGKHINIQNTLKSVYNILKQNYVENSVNNEIEILNGMIVSGAEKIQMIIKQMIYRSKSLDMILVADNECVCSLVAKELHKNNYIDCRCFVYLDNDEFSDFNVNVFSNIVFIMLTEKVSVRYDYTDIEDLSEHSLISQVFIVDDAVLLVDNNFTTAIYLNNEEAIYTYMKIFEEKYSESEEFCKAFSDISSFINGYSEIFDNNKSETFQDVYIIKNCPCIMLETNSDVINRHFKDDSIRAEFIKKYMEFVYKYTVNGIKKQHIMFSVNGIDQLLNADEYYEYNKYIDYPISKELRRKFFGKFIEIAEKKDVIGVNVMEDFFPPDKRHCMNIWSDGKLLLFMNFEDGYRIVIMKNKNIVSAILKCLTDFENIGYIYSKKKTLDIMKDKFNDLQKE